LKIPITFGKSAEWRTSRKRSGREYLVSLTNGN
jgi:hypothetical protein